MFFSNSVAQWFVSLQRQGGPWPGKSHTDELYSKQHNKTVKGFFLLMKDTRAALLADEKFAHKVYRRFHLCSHI